MDHQTILILWGEKWIVSTPVILRKFTNNATGNIKIRLTDARICLISNFAGYTGELPAFILSHYLPQKSYMAGKPDRLPADENRPPGF